MPEDTTAFPTLDAADLDVLLAVGSRRAAAVRSVHAHLAFSH